MARAPAFRSVAFTVTNAFARPRNLDEARPLETFATHADAALPPARGMHATRTGPAQPRLS
jgi:hypothetical protein